MNCTVIIKCKIKKEIKEKQCSSQLFYFENVHSMSESFGPCDSAHSKFTQ